MAACGPLSAQFLDAATPAVAAGEVAWYVERLPKDAGPVLDLMCGGARLGVPLARAGFHVHGVDAAAAMIAIADARSRAAGLVPVLFRQDVAALNLPFRYGAAFVAGGAFQRLTDPMAVRQALNRLAAHLVPPGLLFLDLGVPAIVESRPGAALVEVRTVRVPDGARVTCRSETTVDTEARCIDIRARYERRLGTQTLAREDEFRALTWYDEADIASLLEVAGYRDIAIEPPPATRAGERTFAVRARAVG